MIDLDYAVGLFRSDNSLNIGDRILVNGLEQFKAIIKSIDWIAEESRYKITLDWGEFGESCIYDHDEGKLWHKYNEVN